ncbi:Lanosterol 14-alpha demethylase [Smittium culicis]|uniref:Lanosterol 14-alpha demethylase n=1 Tax=Smittium culicis TaxID=133412 RepID=A0A1R1XJ42_9FUNG|nr:Lanosterol 14-alpha demethylase [Smittium culicis]OMJ18255.1 Lanosterol 14-alpha demethylase [Smittium culicis]
MSIIDGLLTSYSESWNSSPLFTVTSSILILLLTLVAYAQFEQKYFANPNEPPLVHYWVPFIGSMIEFGIQPLHFMKKNREKYGDYFTFLMFGRRMSVCLGPNGNSLVFNAKHDYANAEDAYNHLTKPVFGEDVIYDVPNSILMEQKRMAKSGLTNESFKTYVPIIIDEVNKYLDENWTKDSDVVDIFKAVSEIIIMTASHTLIGPEIRAQLHTGVADLYHTLDASFTPIHFLFKWLPLPSYYSCKSAHEELAQIFSKIIDNRKKDVGNTHEDMLNQFINYKFKDGSKLNDKQVGNMSIAILMAGQHTSSATTAWSLLNLANNHHLLDEAYNEMQDAMGKDLPYPELDDLKKMPILETIVKETLRLRNPIIQIMRKVTKPIAIPGTNYVIQPGSYLVSSPTVTQTDPKYFPNPDKYDPHRWDTPSTTEAPKADDDTPAQSNKNSIVDEGDVDYGFGSINSKSAKSPYLPFGAGRHRCIGEQFAFVQIRTILYTIIKRFDFELDPKRGMPLPDYNSMVILPTGPASIRYIRRKN